MALRGHCGCGGALKAKGSSLRALVASLVSDGGTKYTEVMVNGGGLSVLCAPLVCSVLTAEG